MGQFCQWCHTASKYNQDQVKHVKRRGNEVCIGTMPVEWWWYGPT